MNDDFMARQGWQCPICKRIYSPFTPCCFYCGGEAIIETSTNPNSTGYIDWQKQQTITAYIPQEDTTKTGKLDIGGITITYPLEGKEE